MKIENIFKEIIETVIKSIDDVNIFKMAKLIALAFQVS